MGEFYIFNENVNLRAIGLYRITPNNYIFISAKYSEFYTDKILSFVQNPQNPRYTNLYRLNENMMDTFLKSFTSSINYERYYINGKLIFFTPGISTNPSSGYTIWASDGTDVGTVKIKEHFYSNGGESTRPWGTTQNILKLGNKVYYVNFNDPNNMETWVTDGTASGTILLKNFQIRDINVVNNKNYILADGNIWESDGTSNGTIQRTDFKTNFPDDIPPGEFVQVGNYLLISSSRSLYKYNTTPPCLLNASINSGNWGTPTIWSCGHIPLATEPVQISEGHTITLDVNGVAKSVNLLGILNPQASKVLTIQGN
jgi:ELWxxDGT repeat protein